MLMVAAALGGLALAGAIKFGLKYGWRRLRAPKGRHRGARA